uniref:Uncharacterized protein n=1 Tax=Arion vulgaris TaxID=1028688 RepID=A0A0B7A3X9_9EUPU
MKKPNRNIFLRTEYAVWLQMHTKKRAQRCLPQTQPMNVIREPGKQCITKLAYENMLYKIFY